MGLLDQFSGLGNLNPEQTQGLLAAAANILQNSGIQRTPQSLGQIVGGGMQAYQQSTDAQRRREQEEAQARQMAQYRQMQMRGMQGDINKDAAALARSQRFAEHMGKMPSGSQMPQVGLPQLGAAPQASYPGMPQPQPQRQGAPSSDPYQARMSRAGHMRAGGFDSEADATELDALKFQPKVKNWQEVNIGGKIQYAPYFEDGTHGDPVPLEVARKLVQVDSGQSNDMIDPYTAKMMASFGKKQTLESLASNATTMRGQNMTDARQRDKNAIDREGNQTQIINDPLRGPLLVNKGTGLVRQGMGADGMPVRGEAAFKKEASAKGLIPILNKAEALLDDATGSYAGAAVDQGARWFGGSTKGSRNISQLKVMEGQIMMNQPRMEGPQSNMDVELYRQMAGKIGDPTVPAEEKKAAFKSLREITNRYAGVPDDNGIEDLLDKYLPKGK